MGKAKDEWSVLGRLKRAVNKLSLLLNFNLSRWKLASILSGASSRRRLSFNDRPGLQDCIQDPESEENNSAPALHRTRSYASDDDIDQRAEAFISNFRRHLLFERQVSLELRYYRGNSFDRDHC